MDNFFNGRQPKSKLLKVCTAFNLTDLCRDTNVGKVT